MTDLALAPHPPWCVACGPPQSYDCRCGRTFPSQRALAAHLRQDRQSRHQN